MNKINIYWAALICLVLGVNRAQCMDEEDAVLRIRKGSPEVEYRNRLRDTELEDFFQLLTLPILRKHSMSLPLVLEYLVIHSGGHSSIPAKITYLMQAIDRLDPDKTKVRFDTGQNMLSKAIENHRMISFSGKNTDLQAWIAWFVKRAAPLDNRDPLGNTPLTYAVFYKSPDAVDTLLILGANPSVPYLSNVTEQTVLNLAKTKQKEDPASMNHIISSLEFTKKVMGMGHSKDNILTILYNSIHGVALYDSKTNNLNNDSIFKINYLLAYIDRIDPSKTVIEFKGNEQFREILHELIKNDHTSGQIEQHKDLSSWVSWFVERSVSVDNVNKDGYTALAYAIHYLRPDIVKTLLILGANQTINTKWTPQEFAQHLRDTDPQAVNQILAMLNTPINLLSSSSLTVTPQTSPFISDQHPAPQSSHARWQFFTRSKAFFASLATIITVSTLYKWITDSYIAQPKDILINNTKTTIFARCDNGAFEEIKPGNTLNIAQAKIVTIQLPKDKELLIDLSKYRDTHTKYYLNLIVSKNWLSWLFGPLRTSLHWIEKE